MVQDTNLETADVKTNPKLAGNGDIQDLLEVIQYVITDALNNKEFRQFMIKRFLHNYVPQSTYSKPISLYMFRVNFLDFRTLIM